MGSTLTYHITQVRYIKSISREKGSYGVGNDDDNEDGAKRMTTSKQCLITEIWRLFQNDKPQIILNSFGLNNVLHIRILKLFGLNACWRNQLHYTH